MRMIFFSFLLFGSITWQVFGQHQDQSQATSNVHSQPSQRVCGCQEINQCHNEQVKKEQQLLANCRDQCASQIFLKPTSQKVLRCYDQHDQAKMEADSRRNKCMKEMGSRNCHSPDSNPQPQTFVINTTEFFHAGSKHQTRKISFPDSVNTLNSCTRTCASNQGYVQFSADGSVIKPPKTAKKKTPGEKKQKTNSGDSLCATQLDCQLVPVDKKLEKQARHLCNLQAGPQEDYESALCPCLENALGQNLHCSMESASGTCSSPGSSCSETQKTAPKKTK